MTVVSTGKSVQRAAAHATDDHRVKTESLMPNVVCVVDDCVGIPKRPEVFCSAHHGYQEIMDEAFAEAIDAGLMEVIGKTEWGDPIFRSLISEPDNADVETTRVAQTP